MHPSPKTTKTLGTAADGMSCSFAADWQCMLTIHTSYVQCSDQLCLTVWWYVIVLHHISHIDAASDSS